MLPPASILGLAAFCAAAIRYGYRLGGRSWRPMLAGAAIFFLFSILLENLFHYAILTIPGSRRIAQKAWAYTLYGCVLAATFEEGGRVFAFKELLPAPLDRRSAYAYGIGHGGLELLLTLPAPLLAAGRSLLPGPEAFCMVGERLLAFFGHLALTILVFESVSQDKKRWFILALFLHGLADVPIGLHHYGVLSQGASTGFFAIAVLICWLTAGLVHRRRLQEGSERTNHHEQA